jgi:hypothetical protein
MSVDDTHLRRLTAVCADLKAGRALAPDLAAWVAQQLTRDYWLAQAGHDLEALFAASMAPGLGKRALIMRRVLELCEAASLAEGALSGLANALAAPGLRKHAIIKLAVEALIGKGLTETQALKVTAKWLGRTRAQIVQLYVHEPKRSDTRDKVLEIDPDGLLLAPMGALTFGGSKKIF